MTDPLKELEQALIAADGLAAGLRLMAIAMGVTSREEAPDRVGRDMAEEAAARSGVGPKVHELKTYPDYFQAIVDNRKTFDVRFDDRGFNEGDVLWLREWEPAFTSFGWEGKESPKDPGRYTGRDLRKIVTYVMDEMGTLKGWVILGLGPLYVSPDLQPQPWQPITDPKTLKVLGKTGEEAGELIVALFRCIIQGVDATHPSTGKINREWLAEERADVAANLDLLDVHLELDMAEVEERYTRKRDFLSKWLDMM